MTGFEVLVLGITAGLVVALVAVGTHAWRNQPSP